MTRLVLFELFVTNLLLLSTNEKTKTQKCSLDDSWFVFVFGWCCCCCFLLFLLLLLTVWRN